MFSSDGHSLAGGSIMPIEEVLETVDNTNISSKLLKREEFWIKEISSIYPYDTMTIPSYPLHIFLTI